MRELPETYQFVTVTRPDFEVEVREVPVSSTLAVLPMTQDQLGKEAAQDTRPVAVKSLADCFDKFRPSVRLEVAAKGVRLAFQTEFRNLADFEPDQMQKPKDSSDSATSLHNDLVMYRARIDMLARLREVLTLPHVAEAWKDPKRRAEIIGAVARLQQQAKQKPRS